MGDRLTLAEEYSIDEEYLVTATAHLQREHRTPIVSAAERDILTLLRHLTNKPIGLKEVRRELLQAYSEFQIQEAILNLLERGLIETVYPCGFELGFRVVEGKKQPS